jgi:hypothetical protein
MGATAADTYRRRADEYRLLAAKASDEKERDGLLSVCALLEFLAENEGRAGQGKAPKS